MNLSASNFFVEMLSEIPISSQGPTKVEAQLLHDAERRIEYFDKFRPGYLLYSGLGSEKCWFFEKYADSEKGKWDTLTQKIHEDLSRKQAKHPARVPRFLQRRTAKGRKKHALQCSTSISKMSVELFSPANEIRMHCGSCICLAEAKEKYLGGPIDIRSVVLTSSLASSQFVTSCRGKQSIILCVAGTGKPLGSCIYS